MTDRLGLPFRSQLVVRRGLLSDGEIVGAYVNTITKLLEPARRGPHGFFVSNCLRHHCIDGNYSFDIRIGGESLVEAIGGWAIDGKATRRLDAPQLQSNPTCPPASL